MTGDIILSASPWIGGTRAAGYWEPLKIERTVRGISWEEAIDGLLESAAQSARDLHCNAVVSVQIHVDPYHKDGGHIVLEGTPARLEPLFAGVEVA